MHQSQSLNQIAFPLGTKLVYWKGRREVGCQAGRPIEAIVSAHSNHCEVRKLLRSRTILIGSGGLFRCGVRSHGCANVPHRHGTAPAPPLARGQNSTVPLVSAHRASTGPPVEPGDDDQAASRTISGKPDDQAASRTIRRQAGRSAASRTIRRQAGRSAARLDDQRQDWTISGKTGRSGGKPDDQRQDWTIRGLAVCRLAYCQHRLSPGYSSSGTNAARRFGAVIR
jgi:hypothetical protein